jgi:hypothetical protein
MTQDNRIHIRKGNEKKETNFKDHEIELALLLNADNKQKNQSNHVL